MKSGLDAKPLFLQVDMLKKIYVLILKNGHPKKKMNLQVEIFLNYK